MRVMVKNFPENRQGPFRQIQRAVVAEVLFIVGHVLREGERLGVPTPICKKLAGLIHELEVGKRQFSLKNYADLKCLTAMCLITAGGDPSALLFEN